VLAGLGILFALPQVLGLPVHGARFGLAGAARDFVVPSLLLVALVPIVVTRRAPAVRALAVLPAAAAALTLIGASDWYLNRVALADTHPEGASITWSQPVPARVLRSRTIAMNGRDVTLSPGGTTFFVRHGGWLAQGRGLAVADFETRLVEVAGTTGAFLDDDRLLVFRGGDAKTYPVLAEVRFSAGPKPVWTKPFPVKPVYPTAIEIDRDTGRVYVLIGDPGIGESPVFQTVADASTPIEPIEAPRPGPDDLLGHSFRAGAWEGIFVVKGGRDFADVWWRTAAGERRLGAAVPDLHCPSHPLGDLTLWCLAPDVPILFKVDGKAGTVSRVPGELPYAWSKSMLGQSRLAVLGPDEIGIIDLDARRGTRLTLPETDDKVPSRLAHGGLATLADGRSETTTVVVYAEPTSLP